MGEAVTLMILSAAEDVVELVGEHASESFAKGGVDRLALAWRQGGLDAAQDRVTKDIAEREHIAVDDGCVAEGVRTAFVEQHGTGRCNRVCPALALEMDDDQIGETFARLEAIDRAPVEADLGGLPDFGKFRLEGVRDSRLRGAIVEGDDEGNCTARVGAVGLGPKGYAYEGEDPEYLQRLRS